MSSLLKLGRFTLRQVNARSILVAKPFSTNPYLLKDKTPSNSDTIEDLKPIEAKEETKPIKVTNKDDSTVLVSEKAAKELEEDAKLKDQMLMDKLDDLFQDEADDELEVNWQELNPSDLTQFDPILDFTYDPYFSKNTHAQKFPLENQYPSQPPPADTIIEEKEEVEFSHSMGIDHKTFQNLKKKVLYARTTVNMTAKGKIRTQWALVVVGNGSGAGGYGQAKADDLGVAVQKATQRAIKNMIAFERYDNRTIYHDIEHKFKATNLKLFARPPGFGLRINMYLHEICQCLGYKDLAGKVYGSANPMNVCKAFFEAIQKQKTPQEIAKSRGKKLVDVQYRYYGIDA